MTEARGFAPARAALAGNPSDGYGGAVLAVAIEDLAAEVQAWRARALRVSPESTLVEAAVRRFARHLEPEATDTALEWRTSIPLGVGLGGSSAIVVATLRALSALYSVRLAPVEQAALALAVETEDLRIEAGPQDRVAQAFGGLTYMEFRDPPRYESLDPLVLPPLVIAWRADTGGHSGNVHVGLRARFERGDDEVRAAMRRLGELARAARDALESGDLGMFAACIGGTFDERRRLLALDRRHVAMVETAHGCGASANYTGSGGAIVAVCRDEEHRLAVAQAMRSAGCDVVCPNY